MESADVIVLGAGLAGLRCAQGLRRAGAKVLVLERSRRPGGRCATRIYPGAPVEADYGPVFVHGRGTCLQTWLEAELGDELISGWPARIAGQGRPCQPSAFLSGSWRFGLRRGLNRIAARLAEGLDVRGGVTVRSLEPQPGGFVATDAAGHQWKAPDLVTALALEQTRALLQSGSAAASRELTRFQGLLNLFHSEASLTAVAWYPNPGSRLDWDVWYPEGPGVLLLASNEGTKRGLKPEEGVLVTLQGRSAWSAAHLKEPPELWAAQLVEALARHWGPAWAAPAGLWTHRWEYGRLEPEQSLVQPMVIEVPGTGRLAPAGDLFWPGGGLEAAWLSGEHLAKRLLNRDGTG